jgi:hypothetical protein
VKAESLWAILRESGPLLGLSAKVKSKLVARFVVEGDVTDLIDVGGLVRGSPGDAKQAMTLSLEISCLERSTHSLNGF